MPTPAAAESPARAPATSRVALANAPAVWVTLTSGLESRRVPAVVMRNPAVVLLRFDDFIRCERGVWRDATGRSHALDTAVAIDLERGLLAFAHDGLGAPPVDLGEQDGLFVGLDVQLHTPVTVTAAFVDSAAIERGRADYRYALGGFSALDARLAAVIDKSTEKLLGIALPTEAGWEAMDALSLVRFLDNPVDTPLETMSAVSDFVFSQPLGTAREFDAEINAGRWVRALALAAELADSSPELITPARRSSAHRALARTLEARTAAGQWDEAEQEAATQIQRFGADDTVARMWFALLARRDGIASAVDRFGRRDTGIELDVMQRVLRTAVLDHINDPGIGSDEAMQTLREALARDSDFAPFHRALGLRLFEQARYAEAASHLAQAVELDGGLEATLGRTLALARQRQSAPTNTVTVKLAGGQNALYAPVVLNGGAAPFRFLVDTGASYTAINTRTLLALGYSDVFNQGGPFIELETANGRVFAAQLTLPSMSVGGARINSVPVVVLEDMGRLDGLLGLSFLKHFDVQIDSTRRELTLTPK
ncbi:MAG: retropepsin-like aspartic protease [Pseudomonadota bacterium]